MVEVNSWEFEVRSFVLTCFRPFVLTNEGFQVRWCFKIAVETAAGAVFLPIIKLQLWVRRDGLS